jgi:hypothetical protein
MCWILLKKAEKSPTDYPGLVSHFGKDFLFFIGPDIKIDPIGYYGI